jgi:hypothetical protein
MAELRMLGAGLARLAWVAARTFLATLVAVTGAGLVLAGLSYYGLRSEPVYGVIAALVAVAEAIAAGILLGGKLALVGALVEGVRKLGLGLSLVRLLFERILGVAEGEVGERGGVVANSLERLPLDRAKAWQQEAITGLTAARGEGGWLRHKIRDRLLRLAVEYTLQRFREEAARHGGIDLVRVRTELEERLDEVLLKKARAGMVLWIVGVILGLPLAVALQTYLLIALLRAYM